MHYCSTELRKQVREIFDWTCQYCGVKVSWTHADTPSGLVGGYFGWYKNEGYIHPFIYMAVDRVKPGKNGGEYTSDNVTLACAQCNSLRNKDELYGPVRTLQIMEVFYAS